MKMLLFSLKGGSHDSVGWLWLIRHGHRVAGGRWLLSGLQWLFPVFLSFVCSVLSATFAAVIVMLPGRISGRQSVNFFLEFLLWRVFVARLRRRRFLLYSRSCSCRAVWVHANGHATPGDSNVLLAMAVVLSTHRPPALRSSGGSSA